MSTARRWPGHGAIWRWHFYAGLFCIPFVLWLATTGSIYLFRPQIEAMLERRYDHLSVSGPAADAAAQAEAAVRAVPGSALHRYVLPETPDAAVRVIVGRGAEETRVYVHPVTLAILRTEDEDSRPMRIVFRLHGELMAGDQGSYAVELAASWTIVMILSGLFFWWPRGGGPESRGLGGVVYPRLGGGRRRFWRDIHGVTGFWVSLTALALLLSGLPWAKSWGTYLHAMRSVAEARIAPQDWSAGSGAERAARHHADAAMREHMGHGGMAMPATADYAPIDRIAAAVRPLALAAPVLIAPPAGMHAPWTGKSDAADRPLRTDLTLDPSGRILTREDFGGRPLIDRIVGYGVAAHEGQLFGLANQLLGLFTALGLMTVSVSAVILWWRRRPGDVLGAPPAIARAAPLALGFFALLGVLGLALPLLGGSMIAVLLAERLVLVRLPRARRWLGI